MKRDEFLTQKQKLQMEENGNVNFRNRKLQDLKF